MSRHDDFSVCDNTAQKWSSAHERSLSKLWSVNDNFENQTVHCDNVNFSARLSGTRRNAHPIHKSYFAPS